MSPLSSSFKVSASHVAAQLAQKSFTVTNLGSISIFFSLHVYLIYCLKKENWQYGKPFGCDGLGLEVHQAFWLRASMISLAFKALESLLTVKLIFKPFLLTMCSGFTP